MPSAVALLNYISSGIFWRIFCQTGIFRGVFSLNNYFPRMDQRSCDGRGRGWGTYYYKYDKQLQILVAKGHKNTNAPLILKIRDIIFLVLGKLHNGSFLGIFRGGLDFFDPSIYPLKWPIM